MKQTLLKIIEILAYQQTINEEDRKGLIETAGKEGLFLEQKKLPVVDDTPDKTYVLPHSGIRAHTWDDEEFFFYTDIQGEVENIMIAMGYDTHGYALSFFFEREEPMTPEDFEWPADKRRRGSNEEA